MLRKHWGLTRLLRYGCLVAAVSFVVACHQKEGDASPPAAEKAPAAAIDAIAAAPKASSPRAKPDFGGVTTEHVEVSASGKTLQAAVDNAVRLAVEQVNGKTVEGGALSLATGAGGAANGERFDVQSSGFAQWLATRTSGTVTNFRILSQRQVSISTSADEESLKATKGESWDKGTYDASENADVSASASYQASARAKARDVGEADAEARAGESLDASHEAHASGEWDRHDGAQSLDYRKKHTEYAHEWEVRIAADVAKYRQAASAKLTRVVVARPRSAQRTFHVGDADIPAQGVADQIGRDLTDALTQTHRFTVLDRDSADEVSQEMELIRSGDATAADTARLGQQLATDLIVIPTIDRFEYLRHERSLRLSNRRLVSYSGGGTLSFRVVSAVTGQVVMSQSFRYDLPATAPTTLGASADGSALSSLMMDTLDRKIIGAILQSTFPLSVIQRQGANVVVNQGGDAVTQGATYQAVTLGKELVDPQSGQSLGPTESPCCTVQIDRVTPTMSYGHIVERGLALADPFVPGSMELREKVESANVGSVAAPKKAKPRRTRAASKAGAGPDANDADSNW